jgi:hypothetical protein
MGQFFGKYRGKVAANRDPLHLGRIQVQVPAVFWGSASELGNALRALCRG